MFMFKELQKNKEKYYFAIDCFTECFQYIYAYKKKQKTP